MEKTAQKDIQETNPQTEAVLNSPVSSKRPRTDWANSPCEKSRADFSETFQKTIGFPLSKRTLQKNADLLCTEECGDNEGEEGTKLILPLITNLTTSHADDAHAGSSQANFITAQRPFQILVKDEQLGVTDCDKHSSHLSDDTGEALAESHIADSSSHPDCKGLEESLEDEPQGGYNLPHGNGDGGRQVPNKVSQIQAFGRADEEVRCQPCCSHEEILHGRGFCNTWSQFAEAEGTNQNKSEHECSENLLLGEGNEESNTPISYNDFADTTSFCPNAVEGPSGNLAQGVKNEEKKLQLQISENEDIAISETKGQITENGLNKNGIHCAAECAEGSVVSYDVVSSGNIANEIVNLKVVGLRGARGEHAPGSVIAKARCETADHTAETPMPARITQEPAEGDNYVGPFSVIDPTIWSETDREAGEIRCNSECTAGANCSPSVKVCKKEMSLRLSDIRPSQEVSVPDQTWQFIHRSRSQQCKDEKEDLWQSYTEPQALCITTNQAHHKTGDAGSCLLKSSASCHPKLPPAEDGRQENLMAVGYQLKEQDKPLCFPVLEHLNTQECEHSQIKIAKMDEATEIKGREEVRSGAHGKSEYSMGKRIVQQNNKHEDSTKISACNCNSYCTASESSKYRNDLTHVNMENNLEYFSGDSSNVLDLRKDGITEKNERKEEASVGKETEGNTEIVLIPEDGHHQPSQKRIRDMKEALPDDGISEWTEGKCAKKSTLVCQHEQANKPCCFSDYQHKAERFMAENKDDLCASTFPATSDAVLPSPHELTPSQNATKNPEALNCSDRFSSIPSAFTFCDRMAGGFDTFKRIQLSLDDDDDNDGSLSNSPFTSSAGQLLKTPQQRNYHSMPEAENVNQPKVVPKKEEKEGEEVDRLKGHTENMTNDLLSSDYSSNEVPNFTSTADVTAARWPQQQLNSESASAHEDLNPQSNMSDSPASDFSNSPKFEMKEQFDWVLKELNLYFEFSVSDCMSDDKVASPEHCADVTKASSDKTSTCKDKLSSPDSRPDSSSGKFNQYDSALNVQYTSKGCFK